MILALVLLVSDAALGKAPALMERPLAAAVEHAPTRDEAARLSQIHERLYGTAGFFPSFEAGRYDDILGKQRADEMRTRGATRDDLHNAAWGEIVAQLLPMLAELEEIQQQHARRYSPTAPPPDGHLVLRPDGYHVPPASGQPGAATLAGERAALVDEWQRGRSGVGWSSLAVLVGYGAQEGFLVDLTEAALHAALLRAALSQELLVRGEPLPGTKAYADFYAYPTVADAAFFETFSKEVERVRDRSGHIAVGLVALVLAVAIGLAWIARRMLRRSRHDGETA